MGRRIYKDVEVEIEVNEIIDELDDDELVDELERRLKIKKMDDDDVDHLREILSIETGELRVITIDDRMKFQHLTEVFGDYTADELAQLIPKK